MSNIVRIPISTLAQLNQLDDAEMMEGYEDGLGNAPEPGDNRSTSYWHGWRNGMADKGHIPIDGAMRALAHEIVEDSRRKARA